MKMIHVKGENKGSIILYTLSTCGWCKKTKKFLGSLGVEYSYIDVDSLNDNERDKLNDEIEKWDPQHIYPAVVIDNKKCIIGYKKDEIKEAIHL